MRESAQDNRTGSAHALLIDGDHYPPHYRARLHRLERAAHFIEAEPRVHDRMQPFGIGQLQHGLVRPSPALGVETAEFTGAHSYDRDLLKQSIIYGRCRNPPPGKANHQDPAERRDAVQRFIENVASHRVENDIRPATFGQFLHRIPKPTVGIIDTVVRALYRRDFEFRFGRSRRDHTCAEHLAHFDRGEAYPPRRPRVRAGYRPP